MATEGRLLRWLAAVGVLSVVTAQGFGGFGSLPPAISHQASPYEEPLGVARLTFKGS